MTTVLIIPHPTYLSSVLIEELSVKNSGKDSGQLLNALLNNGAHIGKGVGTGDFLFQGQTSTVEEIEKELAPADNGIKEASGPASNISFSLVPLDLFHNTDQIAT